MKNTILRIVEILVLGGILTAFILPLLVPSQETAEVENRESGVIASNTQPMTNDQ